MVPVYWLIWGAVATFGASAVAALAWAVRDGQMHNPAAAAASIFDAAEPVGEVTDAFPGPSGSPRSTPEVAPVARKASS
jgi:hypothetical protein